MTRFEDTLHLSDFFGREGFPTRKVRAALDRLDALSGDATG